MPELPEVESVGRVLKRLLLHRPVTGLRGRAIKLRRPLHPARLARQVVGDSFIRVRRRGKYLLLDLAGGGSLLVHLGMSGRLHFTGRAERRAPHTHLRIEFSGRRELRYIDPRRFGLVAWLAPGAEAADPALDKLGIEPLLPSFPRQLPLLLQGRLAPIKALLLDQRLVAGVGNIYADESLFAARIHPGRSPAGIRPARIERLGRAIQEVLRAAIAQGGTTIRDHLQPDGWEGRFASHLKVYGRGGSPCMRCGRRLRRSRIAGRGTVSCSRCQR